MGKIKTKRTVAKRFKVTAKGKVMRRRSHANHFLAGKTRKQKRKLTGETPVSGSDYGNLRRCLPYDI